MTISRACRTTSRAVCMLVLSGSIAAAQAPAPAAAPPIRDNSFLIEEAYNQEWGVVQHVGTFQKTRGSRAWAATFTQEWPAPGERHQLSYTVPLLRTVVDAGYAVGLGDVALNYRYQVAMRPGSAFALAPRVSLSMPVGDEQRDRGEGTLGLELNLPASLEMGRLFVTHFNAGARWGDGARIEHPSEVFVGQSLIALLHPRFNLMLEALWTGEVASVSPDDSDERTLVIAPGIRGAFDFASGLQVVPGIAVPMDVAGSERVEGVFLYLSFEHPFRRR